MSEDRRHGLSQALTQIPAGAYVLTLNDAESGPQAIVLSFVQQVGFNPPRIMASIYKERPILLSLERTQAFVLNVWSEGRQRDLSEMAESAAEFGKTRVQFGAQEWGPGFMLEAASACLACRVTQRVDIGDHWVYIADVDQGVCVAGRSPLVHVRRSGMRY